MPRAAHAAVLCAALLTGCNSGAKQQQLAMEATLRLGGEFMSGTCQSVYERTEYSRSNNDQIRRQWLDGCEQIRAAAGVCRGINVHSVRRLPGEPEAILVVGDAVFENGTYHLESYWYLNRDRAELYALELEGNGKRISIPPLTPAERKLMDPPPPPRGTPQPTSLGPTRPDRRATGNERRASSYSIHRSSA